MAVKYYDDGTYTKGDGKLYKPGVGVIGSDKSGSSTTSSSTNKNTSTSSGSNKNTSSSSGISSMYQNNTSGSTGNSLLDGVKNTMSSNTMNAISNTKNNTSILTTSLGLILIIIILEKLEIPIPNITKGIIDLFNLQSTLLFFHIYNIYKILNPINI